jgi:hypothetical protein
MYIKPQNLIAIVQYGTFIPYGVLRQPPASTSAPRAWQCLVTSLAAANLSPGIRELSALIGRSVQDHGDCSQHPESHPSGGAPAIQVAVTL